MVSGGHINTLYSLRNSKHESGDGIHPASYAASSPTMSFTLNSRSCAASSPTMLKLSFSVPVRMTCATQTWIYGLVSIRTLSFTLSVLVFHGST